MDIGQIIKSVFTIDIWLVAKVFVLFGLLVYLVFSFVVVRQVKLMTQVVSGILSGPLKALSWLFFLFSLLVFVLAIIFL